MTDIVTRLRKPPFGTETSERNLMLVAADEIERLLNENSVLAAGACHIPNGLVGDEHGHPVCQPTEEVERLRAALDRYREAASIDVKMESPRYMGCNQSAFRRAWEADADKFK